MSSPGDEVTIVHTKHGWLWDHDAAASNEMGGRPAHRKGAVMKMNNWLR